MMEGLVQRPKSLIAAEGERPRGFDPSCSTEQGLHLVLVEPQAICSSTPSGRLFLGTQKAAQNRILLLSHGISSIICVGTPAFHQEAGGDGTFEYLEIQLLDLPSENLLTRLDEAVSFVWDSMRRGKGVLVNCVFAQSRSAAVVAAYLMKQKGCLLSQALAEVRRAQPTVHINPGFKAQLTLYQDLGCRLPGGRSSAITDGINVWAGATYRWFLSANGLKNSHSFGPLRSSSSSSSSNSATRCTGNVRDEDKMGVLDRYHQGKFEAQREPPKFSTQAVFRCKICRHPLFTEGNVINHFHPLVRAASDSTYASFRGHGDGSSWLAWRDAVAATRGKKKETPRSACRDYINEGMDKGPVASTCARKSMDMCTSVFTEPLDWIKTCPRVEGKITCPGVKGSGGAACGGKLGAWSLNGTDCSCGATVRPAVRFILSRIERGRSG